MPALIQKEAVIGRAVSQGIEVPAAAIGEFHLVQLRTGDLVIQDNPPHRGQAPLDILAPFERERI